MAAVVRGPWVLRSGWVLLDDDLDTLPPRRCACNFPAAGRGGRSTGDAGQFTSGAGRIGGV